MHNSFSYICLFQFSTCFEQQSAHHQKNQLYQYALWYMSLCVGDRAVHVTLCRWPCGTQFHLNLHTTRSPTHSDMYHRSYWYSWLSWWSALDCLKHVENWNKQISLLTHSMVQSPSWAANWFAASQEIPRISRNPKVYYRTHKRPPPVCILGQPNPVPIPTSHLLQIHPNIIHPSMPRSPLWSLSLRFPHQDPTHTPLLTQVGYLLRLLPEIYTDCHFM